MRLLTAVTTKLSACVRALRGKAVKCETYESLRRNMRRRNGSEMANAGDGNIVLGATDPGASWRAIVLTHLRRRGIRMTRCGGRH